MEGFVQGFHTGFITLPQGTFECKNLLSAGTDMEAVDRLLQSELDKDHHSVFLFSLPFGSGMVTNGGGVLFRYQSYFRVQEQSLAFKCVC